MHQRLQTKRQFTANRRRTILESENKAPQANKLAALIKAQNAHPGVVLII